ncbi:MAG: phage repressor protein/antirepressor Ant [Clostridiales bacterium]|nr:phage repressor protein/antirepressor Ant [Clostridiales bacterium]
MDNIQVFTNRHFGRVRVVTRDGEPWFIASDVCRALEVGNNRQALSRLDEDEKGVILNDTPGGKQSMAVVSEPGLYALVLGSRKPEAQSFRRWITHEVLPAIRQEGAYMTPERLHKVLEDPDTLIALAQRLKLLQEKNRTLAAKNVELLPKADYFDRLVDHEVNLTLRETAKELGVKERSFIDYLIEHGYLYRDKKQHLMPYADHVDTLFAVKECINERTGWGGTQTLVTPQGRDCFRRQLC